MEFHQPSTTLDEQLHCNLENYDFLPLIVCSNEIYRLKYVILRERRAFAETIAACIFCFRISYLAEASSAEDEVDDTA